MHVDAETAMQDCPRPVLHVFMIAYTIVMAITMKHMTNYWEVAWLLALLRASHLFLTPSDLLFTSLTPLKCLRK